MEYPSVKLVAVAAPAPAPAPAPVEDAIPARVGKVFLSYSETGAEVWVDGTLRGALPLTIELTGGPHT